MKRPKGPKRWANDINVLLNARGGSNRFPVNVRQLALDYSRQLYPDDRISLVKGASLPGFEGALMRASPGEIGWGIFHNSAVSPGRVNFTLAHEFGHYLLHRERFPEGLRCSAEDMTRWDSQYRQVEQEANEFSANLLMPFDDFRRQIDDRARPNLDDIGACAERYGVSLIAAVLRWLQFTRRRAVLVKSIDGFIHWSWSSESALRSGAYFKTAGRPPIEVSPSALVANPDKLKRSKGTALNDAGVWLPEPCTEHALVSDRFEFSLSLLHLGDSAPRFDDQEEPEEDTYERIVSRTPGSSWLG